MDNSNIWSNLIEDKNDLNYIQGTSYHTLNRNNLSIYMNTHDLANINHDSLIDFFSKSNLSNFDEGTGWYLSHLLFYRKFSEEKLKKMLELVFDYVSVYQGTEKEGYSYLHTLFMQNTPYSNQFIFDVIEQAKTLDVDFAHQAYDGTIFYHWAVLNFAFNDSMEKLNAKLPKDFQYNHYKDKQNNNAEKLQKILQIFGHYIEYRKQNFSRLEKEFPGSKELLLYEIFYFENYIEIKINDTVIARFKDSPLYKTFFELTSQNIRDLIEKNDFEFFDFKNEWKSLRDGNVKLLVRKKYE